MAPDLSGATWRKSSRSGGNGQCVEMARIRDAAAVRDSKNPDGAVLVFGGRTFTAFLAAIKTG